MNWHVFKIQKQNLLVPSLNVAILVFIFNQSYFISGWENLPNTPYQG
jgi:hypothetical protein